MAIFIPSLSEILASERNTITQGEWQLLQILQGLSNEYTVYFQPHINSLAYPDVVVIHPRKGILIIEVKDWNLPSYQFHAHKTHGYWTVSDEDAHLTSPFEQVERYKNELYDLLSPELCTKNIYAKELTRHPYSIVQCAVFFSTSSYAQLCTLYAGINLIQEHHYQKYTKVWCCDDSNNIVRQINQWSFHSSYDAALHQAITALFSRSEEEQEQDQPFILTKEQQVLAAYQPHSRRIGTKIKGIAGSGKTFVIAQKAINCYNGTKKPVLILTYNITLCHYIRDKIARNTRGWSTRMRDHAFRIIHFDKLIPALMDTAGLKSPLFIEDDGEQSWEIYRRECISLLYQNRHRVDRYATILIDEAQDYQREWIAFLQDVVLEEHGEMLVCGDEKQNVFDRPLEPGNHFPSIPRMKGRWAILKQSFRMTHRNAELALAFQKQFMAQLQLDELSGQMNLFDTSKQFYYDLSQKQNPYENIADRVNTLIKQEFCSPNDICIMASNAETLREIDFVLRQLRGNNCTTSMCESKEIYEYILRNVPQWKQKEEVEKVRRVQKYAFRMNKGTIKLCTIHSFKGWEITTAILILTKNDDAHQLIYTAITRAKKNLLIINLGNEKYADFFSSYMDKLD